MNSPNSNTPAPINASVPSIQTMHGDTSSSDTTILRGPGTEARHIVAPFTEARATFPTLLRRSDGNIMALATSFPDLKEKKRIQAQVWLIDGDSGDQIGSAVTVPQISMFGGVYAYLDQLDNGLVVTSAEFVSNQEKIKLVTKIKKYLAATDGNGELQEGIDIADISDQLYPPQPNPANPKNPKKENLYDSIVSLSPDKDGDIWFASAQGKIGVCHIDSAGDAQVSSISIDKPETINNSFSTAHHSKLGVVAAVASNKKLYLFTKTKSTHSPQRYNAIPYDAGHKLKPGQLPYPNSFFVAADQDTPYGTGATPSFFGVGDDKHSGANWVTITDNATDALNLLVYDVLSGEKIICYPLFDQLGDYHPFAKGTENSSLAYKNTIIVPSTRGYPYPVPPSFDHEMNPFVGGMERIDIVDNGNGGYVAKRIWMFQHRSAAVPKYSITDDVIYTITRHSAKQSSESEPSSSASIFAASMDDQFYFTAINFCTGLVECEKQLPLPWNSEAEKFGNNPEVLKGSSTPLNSMGNPLQMACCFTIDSKNCPVMWQGTMSGYYRISSHSS